MNHDHTHRPFTRRQILVAAGASTLASTVTSLVPNGRADAQTSRPRIPPKFDTQRFVDDCKQASLDTEPQQAVRDVLAREIANPNAVLSGVGAPQKGGIQTLYRSPTLTVLNIVWAPLMQLMPHEHNMWALIGIYTGREDNIFWRRQDGRLSAVNASAISTGNVVPLTEDVIHSVANPIEKLTGAIHIYGGDFFTVHRSEWDPEMLSEREWDIQAAVKLFEQSNDRFFGWQQSRVCP